VIASTTAGRIANIGALHLLPQIINVTSLEALLSSRRGSDGRQNLALTTTRTRTAAASGLHVQWANDFTCS